MRVEDDFEYLKKYIYYTFDTLCRKGFVPAEIQQDFRVYFSEGIQVECLGCGWTMTPYNLECLENDMLSFIFAVISSFDFQPDTENHIQF